MVQLWNQLSLSIHDGTMLHTPSRQEEPVSGPALFARAERTAGSILEACDGRMPRRAGLLMANGEPWVRGLLALLRLDAAAVPLALPVAFGGADAYATHIQRIAADASLDALLVDGSLGNRIVSRVAAAVPHLPFIDISEPPHSTLELPAVSGGGSAPAVIQYTSGSTVFSDGPVDGKTVLVHGVLGGVGSLAAQLARWGGATVIATVRHSKDLGRVDPAVVSHAVTLDQGDPAKAIRAHAPDGVHRIVEVALSDNADLDAAVAANDAVIAAYATRDDRPQLPFWPLLFANVTLRLLGSDDFPSEAKRQAARDLTAAAAVGALTVGIGDSYPLEKIAQAHDRVDAGGRGRVLVTLPQ